jgi:hypothetical protein
MHLAPRQPIPGCVTGEYEMDIRHKAGLHLLLIVAAALGCSASVLSGTVAAIQYAAVESAEA